MDHPKVDVLLFASCFMVFYTATSSVSGSSKNLLRTAYILL